MFSCVRRKVIRDTGGRATGISNLETRCRGVTKLTIWLLYLWANIHSYPTKRTLYGFQGQFGRVLEEENNYRLFQEAASP
jgi:hypothetical protein